MLRSTAQRTFPQEHQLSRRYLYGPLLGGLGSRLIRHHIGGYTNLPIPAGVTSVRAVFIAKIVRVGHSATTE